MDSFKPFKTLTVKITLAVYILYAVLTAFVPLVSAFGFEFNLFLATIASFCAAMGAVSWMFGRWTDTDETGRVSSIVSNGIFQIALRNVLLQFALLAIPIVIHSLISLVLHRTCNWAIGFAWFGLLAPVSIVYGTFWGILIGSFLKSRGAAMTVAALFVLSGILISIYEIAVGPHCFAFNPFFGYFPGPIYDRVVDISDRFLVFRFSNLVTAVFIGCFTSIVLKVSLRRGGKREPDFSLGELFFGLLSFAFILIFSSYRADLGITSSERIVQKELSGLKTTEHFLIHYPPDGIVADQIELIAADHEFRYDQITTELSIQFPRKVHSYIYLSDDQKKRLQGAGSTMYADVANAAIHMSYRDFPHHVLKHELTHVLTAVWGIPYFGWSAKLALTEGVAVSVEGYRRDGSIHDWAAAMKKLDKLPDIEKIMGPLGFWTKLSSLSYLAAGSFSLWLIETEGVEKYSKMYKWGDFEESYSSSLEILKEDWQEFLDSVEVSDRMILQARHSFNRRSLFDQRCARETERLLKTGWRKYNKGLYHEAIGFFKRAGGVSPEEPKIQRAMMAALIGAKDYSRAYSTGEQLIELNGGTDVLRPDYTGSYSAKNIIRTLIDLARIDWMAGDYDAAEEKFEIVKNTDFGRGYTRTASCALSVLNDPEMEPFIRFFFFFDINESARLYYLMRAADMNSKAGIPQYLLGRYLFQNEDYFAATTHLLNAIKTGQLDFPVKTEGLFTLARALYFQKRFAESTAVFQILLNEPITKGRQMNVEEWIGRVEFTERYLGNLGS